VLCSVYRSLCFRPFFGIRYSQFDRSLHQPSTFSSREPTRPIATRGPHRRRRSPRPIIPREATARIVPPRIPVRRVLEPRTTEGGATQDDTRNYAGYISTGPSSKAFPESYGVAWLTSVLHNMTIREERRRVRHQTVFEGHLDW
jgi:hypothetical protein